MRKVILQCEKCKDSFRIDIAILKGCGYFWQCDICGKQQFYKPIAEPDRREKYRYPIACRKGL